MSASGFLWLLLILPLILFISRHPFVLPVLYLIVIHQPSLYSLHASELVFGADMASPSMFAMGYMIGPISGQ